MADSKNYPKAPSTAPVAPAAPAAHPVAPAAMTPQQRAAAFAGQRAIQNMPQLPGQGVGAPDVPGPIYTPGTPHLSVHPKTSDGEEDPKRALEELTHRTRYQNADRNLTRDQLVGTIKAQYMAWGFQADEAQTMAEQRALEMVPPEQEQKDEAARQANAQAEAQRRKALQGRVPVGNVPVAGQSNELTSEFKPPTR